MPQRTQVLTLCRHAKVNWLPPGARKTVPAVVIYIDSTDAYTDVEIELAKAGGGYVAGDRVSVSARHLSPRGRA